jgi:hypothetical protein
MHLAGFLASIDSAGAFAAVTPLADPMLFIQGNNIRVPGDMPGILWAAGGADGVVIPRWRLTSPQLIAEGRPEIKPLNVQNAAAVVPDSPPGIEWFMENILNLKADELLFAELNNNPAAAQVQWLLTQFADKVPAPIVNAPIRTHRATSTTAAVANAWTNVVIAFDDNLPEGTYAVVGLRPQSTTMIAARMVFQSDANHRPGALGSATAQGKTDKLFRMGRLGEWGRFPFQLLPTIDVLCTAADAAQEFEVDLIRVG